MSKDNNIVQKFEKIFNLELLSPKRDIISELSKNSKINQEEIVSYKEFKAAKLLENKFENVLMDQAKEGDHNIASQIARTNLTAEELIKFQAYKEYKLYEIIKNDKADLNDIDDQIAKIFEIFRTTNFNFLLVSPADKNHPLSYLVNLHKKIAKELKANSTTNKNRKQKIQEGDLAQMKIQNNHLKLVEAALGQLAYGLSQEKLNDNFMANHKENLIYSINLCVWGKRFCDVNLIKEISQYDNWSQEKQVYFYSTINFLINLRILDQYITYGKHNNNILVKLANLHKTDAFNLLLDGLYTTTTERMKVLSAFVTKYKKTYSEKQFCENTHTEVLLILNNDSKLIKAYIKNFLKKVTSKEYDLSIMRLLAAAVISEKSNPIELIEVILNSAKKISPDAIKDIIALIPNEVRFEKFKESLAAKFEKINSKNIESKSQSKHEYYFNLEEKFVRAKKTEKPKTKKEKAEEKFELFLDLDKNSQPITYNSDKEKCAFLDWKKSKNKQQEQTEDCSSWYVKGALYKTTSENIYHHNYKNQDYYFTINDKICNKIGANNQQFFQKAIEKGVCDHAFGQTGIKIFENIVELKISEDIRLIATEGYCNAKYPKKILVIFNKSGNHSNVKDIVTQNKDFPVFLVNESYIEDNSISNNSGSSSDEEVMVEISGNSLDNADL